MTAICIYTVYVEMVYFVFVIDDHDVDDASATAIVDVVSAMAIVVVAVSDHDDAIVHYDYVPVNDVVVDVDRRLAIDVVDDHRAAVFDRTVDASAMSIVDDVVRVDSMTRLVRRSLKIIQLKTQLVSSSS